MYNRTCRSAYDSTRTGCADEGNRRSGGPFPRSQSYRAPTAPRSSGGRRGGERLLRFMALIGYDDRDDPQPRSVSPISASSSRV